MVNVQIDSEAAVKRVIPKMESEGSDLNKKINEVFKKCEEMHNSWNGKRYNGLVQKFNNMTDDLNKIIQLVVIDIPTSIKTVVNNYSQFDSGTKIANSGNAKVTRVSNIPVPAKDVGTIIFDESRIESIKNYIIDNFKKIQTTMDSIEKTLKSFTWTGEAAESVKRKLNTLKTKIVNLFKELETEFTNSMKLTIADANKAEKANTVQ